MNADDFRVSGREMVDLIANYLSTISTRTPLPDVSPGYIRELLPDSAPEMAESWESVKRDIERVIMPGVTHWHSPHFHAYFPTGNSFPSLLADMLSDAIGCIGFSWASSPACTELEVVMMDWLAKMLDLPKEFLFSHEGLGGGVIQSTASEATLVALLSARSQAIDKLKEENPEMTTGQALDKLVAYTSELSHSSVERAGLIGLVRINALKPDKRGSLSGPVLESAIRDDLSKGLVPFFVCANIGTTSLCSFDDLKTMGPVCTAHKLWLHVDAAYAGSACICPEFRYLIEGVEHASSYNFNPHKWLMINFDCSAMWVKNRRLVCDAFEMNPLYLQHEHEGVMPDYRHWHIPLGRRFRSLKLWFTFRMFGISGLQRQIRKDVSLAKQFERLVSEDSRFEIIGDVVLGLVCFRLRGPNALSEELNKKVNNDRRIHMTPSRFKDVYFLRFAVCATSTQLSDITFAWKVINEITDNMAIRPDDQKETSLD